MRPGWMGTRGRAGPHAPPPGLLMRTVAFSSFLPWTLSQLRFYYLVEWRPREGRFGMLGVDVREWVMGRGADHHALVITIVRQALFILLR